MVLMILMKRWTIVGCVLLGMIFAVGCEKPPKPRDTATDDGTTSIHDVSIADDVEVEEIKVYTPPADSEKKPAASKPGGRSGGRTTKPPAETTDTGGEKPATPETPAAPETPAEPKKPVAPKAAASNTPKAVLDDIRKATLAGDKAAFLRNLDIAPKDKPVVTALLDASFALTKFLKAVEKQYGKDALKAANAKEFVMPTMMLFAEGDCEIKEEGDSAVATITKVDGNSTTTETVQFVKKGGKWLMKMDDVPAGSERDKVLKKMKAVQAVAEKHQGMVGKQGQTAEKILNGFRQEMMKAITGAAGKPGPTSKAGPVKTTRPGLHFWCTEAEKEFVVKPGAMGMGEEMNMMEDPSSYRVKSPYSGKKTGIQMIKCPECEKYYVPESWKKGRGGMMDPKEKIVCPHCGTDRAQWYRDRRKRRKKR